MAPAAKQTATSPPAGDAISGGALGASPHNVSKLCKDSHVTRTNLVFGGADGTEEFSEFFHNLEAMSSTDKQFILAFVVAAVNHILAPGARTSLNPKALATSACGSLTASDNGTRDSQLVWCTRRTIA